MDDFATYLLERFYLAIVKDSPEETIARKRRANERKPSITSLIYECLRRCYYQLTIPGNSINPDGAVKAWVGTKCHETNILGAEMEISCSWEGMKGRIDEYDPEKKILLDKKTTRFIPREPWPHHIKQIEYYKILLEENGKPVDKAAICYIDVNSGKVKNIPVKFYHTSAELKTEMLEKRNIIQKCLDSGILPPRKIRTWDAGGVNLVCQYCSYFGRCLNEDGIDLRWKKE